MTQTIAWTERKVKTADLVPASYNPRKISKKEREELTKSIEQFGRVEPVIVNTGSRANHVIGGHQRIKIYADLGITEIEAKLPSRELTEVEEKELYRPELYVFLEINSVVSKSISFLKKKDDFSEKVFGTYEENLELLFQNLENLKSNFDSLGIHSDELSKAEIMNRIYHFLNPKRSQTESLPRLNETNTTPIDPEILFNEPWLADSSPREQLFLS